MNTDTLVANLQEHAAIYAVGGVAALVITIVFRRWVLPVLYHCAEFLVYCTVVHVVFGGAVRMFSWFRAETEFKNFKGEIDSSWTPYVTPLDLHFWQMKAYSPQWLFWFELAMAAGLLYIVIVIRPTRLKHKAVRSKRPKPGELSSSTSSSYSERLRAAGRGGMKSAKSR